MSLLEKLYYITGIALFLATVISVITAMLEYRHSKKRSRKMKACELAKHYADSILPRIGPVVAVIDASGLSKFLKEIFTEKEIRAFDYTEMTRLLKDRKESDIENMIESIPSDILLQIKMMHASNNMERNEILRNYCGTDKSEGSSEGSSEAALTIDKDSLLLEFRSSVMKLLNELETFAMYFNYNIADEELVYQSLHQTYTSNVQLLYYFISKINKFPWDKLYVNIIQLYNKWHDCVVEEQRKWIELNNKNAMHRMGQPL